MTIALAIVAVVLLGLFLAMFLKSQQLQKLLADRDAQVTTAKQESYKFNEVIEDILQVAPATTNIAVVLGDSQVERYFAGSIQQEWAPFTNRLGFTWRSVRTPMLSNRAWPQTSFQPLPRLWPNTASSLPRCNYDRDPIYACTWHSANQWHCYTVFHQA